LVFTNNMLMATSTAQTQSYTVANRFRPGSSAEVTVWTSVNPVSDGVPAGASFTGAIALHSAALAGAPSTSSVFGYYMYRATGTSTMYTQLNSTPITVTNFTDVTVQAGQTYTYRVTAVDSFTVERPFSDPVSAVIPTP
jgi:hypothetical protein